MSDLISRLQGFMRNSEYYKQLFAAQEAQLSSRDAVIADLRNQLFVSTATWALEIYEIEVGLVVDKTKTYEERRSRIKAKLRGSGVVGIDLIKSVVESWTGGSVDVSFANSTITISFTDVTGQPTNMDDVEFAIEEIKPAHLAVMYVFLYNLWADIEVYTWGELEAYTWEEVMSSDLT